MKLLVGVSALFLAASCPPVPNPPNPIPTPTPFPTPCPTPTPTPTPDPSHMTGKNCLENSLTCDCIDFPPPGNATCVICDPTSPTGTKPIGIVPVCPPVVTPPTPIPPLPPANCSFPQGVPEGDYKEVPNPAQYSKVVDDTIREHTTCHGSTDCEWGPNDPQSYLAAMITALQLKGYCAGQHTNGVSDQISVALSCSPGVTWENYQPVNFGGTIHKARFSPGNIMSGWQVPICSPTNPTPPTPVPPTIQCNDFTGFRDIHVLSRVGDRININTTPEGCNREKCDALGWTGRNCCPLGTYGGTQEACEKELVGSSVFSLLSDNPITSVNQIYTNETSPFLGVMKVTPDFLSASIKVCGFKAPTVCTNGTIQ